MFGVSNAKILTFAMAPIFHMGRPNLGAMTIFNVHIIYLIWTKVLGGYMPGRFSRKKCRRFFLTYMYFYFIFFESFWLTCICIICLSFYLMSRFNPPLCLPFPVKKFFFEHNIKLSKSPHKDWHILQVASPRTWSKVSIYSVSSCRKSKQ